MTTKKKKYTDDERKIIGKRINKIRLEKGMTMEEFADLFGTSKSNVSMWERGRSLPNPKRMKQIAKLCDTTVEELASVLETDSIKKLTHKEAVEKVLSITSPNAEINERALDNVVSLVSELYQIVDFSLPDIAVIYSYNNAYKDNQIYNAKSYLNYLKNKRSEERRVGKECRSRWS